MNNESMAYETPTVEVLGNLSDLTRGNSGNAGNAGGEVPVGSNLVN
jgi:hypothetical protein